VASVTRPNGATSSTTYDTYGRVSGTTSPDGVGTTMAYTYNPNTVKETVGTGAMPGGRKARWMGSAVLPR
jgi:YD repeat-containing protein